MRLFAFLRSHKVRGLPVISNQASVFLFYSSGTFFCVCVWGFFLHKLKAHSMDLLSNLTAELLCLNILAALCPNFAKVMKTSTAGGALTHQP